MGKRSNLKTKQTQTERRKSVGMRIFILVLAVAMVASIIILPIAVRAEETDGVSVTVAEFDTGKLSEAISDASEGTDFNFISKIAVLKGTLSADDYAALTNIPNLEYIELAGTETEDGVIPEDALPYRNQLKYISLPKNTVEIGAGAFSNNKKLEKISMPSSVEKIGDRAFEACEALKEFPINENISYIGEGAFRDCKSITEFAIPSGITEIYPYTFSKCGFSEIIIGPNVEKIGDGAFGDCGALKDVYSYSKEAPVLDGQGVFMNVGASIHVYEDCAESYLSWEGNNIKVTEDLTGDYPYAAENEQPAVTEAVTETEAETADTETEEETTETETETEASTVKEEEPAEETSAAVQTSAPSQGVSVGTVIVIAVVCVIAGAAVALVGFMLGKRSAGGKKE